MSATQDVVARGSGAVAREAATGAAERRRQLSILPAVSIFEGSDQITLEADMPGVAKEGLEVRVDHNVLTVKGEADLDLPVGMTALYADLRTTRYERSFALSGELDTENISATLKDGVLTLRIPKRAEYRARKINVNVS